MDEQKSTSAREERIRRREEERRLKKQKRAFHLRVGCSIFLLLILVAMVALGLRMMQINENTRSMEAQNAPAVEVSIKEGASVAQIAEKLEAKGVISNATAFKWFCRFRGYGADFKAGNHRFPENASFRMVAEELNNNAGGGVGTVKILVREGETIDQIAKEVEKQTGKPAKEFIKAVSNPELIAQLEKKYPELLSAVASNDQVKYTLEGYLFPATYEYSLQSDLSVLISQMVQKTNEVVSPYFAEIKSSGRSVNEVMTMASLVEKEGKTTDDRKKIASVFYNRLAKNMPIQSDISVLYALGQHKEVVTLKDLEVKSPYNLYKHDGLAPGPMNNPSKDAIEATVYPTHTNAIYFFANIKTGKVFFTDSFEQHLAWQKEYEETGTVTG